jgi:hypothetical protein
MTDSVYAFPPGERLTDDSTGAPLSGGKAKFYDAQTTNPKTVYSDAALTVELGTDVVTDSLGYPTSDGTTRTLVYVGTAPYKIVLEDADGNTIATHDDIPGAVVSASSVDVSVTATFPVATKSLPYAVVAADQNSTFLVNCSSANVTLTLPSATDNDIPNGWKIKVQHAGSANKAIVVVKSGSGQSIFEGTKTLGGGSFALALNGEDCEITADGGNWRITSHTPPFIKKGQGIIPVVSRVSTSPASPNAGDIYILTGVGGSWSTFAARDLALYTGAGWTNFTPYTDCGWVAYVQNENAYYRFIDSAWVSEFASTTVFGTVKYANQSAMEAETSGAAAGSDAIKYSPGVAKFWLEANVSGGVPTLQNSYNTTSISDTGDGRLGVTIATDFSSANWAAIGSPNNVGIRVLTFVGALSGSVEANARDPNNVLSDPGGWNVCGFGDQ